MKTANRSKQRPEIGHSSERLYADAKMKPKFKTQAGVEICRECSAVGMRKHWFADSRMYQEFAADELVRYVLCPGCKRVESGILEGEVFLKSPLLAANQEMIYGTIYHTAAKAFHENPLSRIATLEDSGDQIHILTTTCSLAERIGKAINRALNGKLEIKPSKNEKFVIVRWNRALEKE